MSHPNRLALLLLLSSALFAACGARAAEPWPQIPSPPRARVQWVGDNMRVNGVPTRIQQFQSRAGRTEVVEYYREYWSGGYPTKPSIKPLGAATVISQKHGPYFMTVKVEDGPGGASQGLISVSRMAGSRVEFNPGSLPLMPGAKVVSVVESSDPGKTSREVVVLGSQPPQSVLQFYQGSYGDGGWRQVQSNEVARTARNPGGAFVVFARDATEMQLSITDGPEGKGCVLVANEVTKDTAVRGY